MNELFLIWILNTEELMKLNGFERATMRATLKCFHEF